MRKRVVPGMFVVSLLLLAGCGGDPSYALRPVVDVTETDDSIQVDGTVALEGKYGGELQIKGVVVELSRNNSTINRFNIGTLNQTRSSANFSHISNDRPTEIRVFYRDITPENYDGTTYYWVWQPEEQIYAEEVAQDAEISANS